MLSQERQGEIALVLLKKQIKDEGLRLHPQKLNRKIGDLAKKTGIPAKELKEFGLTMARELFQECFGEKAPV